MITNLPRDENQHIIQSISGIKTIFAAPEMDGVTFKPITLATDSKCINIQASNGMADDFTSFASNPVTFHFSMKENPSTGEWTQHIREFRFDCVAAEGLIKGYVRAQFGVVISVMVGA